MLLMRWWYIQKCKFYFLKNDYLFKSIFSIQKYQKYILEVIFGIKVKSYIRLLDTNFRKNYKSHKVGIVNLLLEFDNKKYVLELQNQNQYNLEERLLFYGCSLYSKELLEGEDYKKLNILGVLALVNHDFKDNKLYDKFFFKSYYTNKIFSKKLDIRICNIKKASKETNINDKKVRLAKFIACTDITKLEQLALGDKILEEIVLKMKEYNLDEKERQKMELWDNNFESEERLHKRIMKVGEKKGERRGRKEGINTGIKSVANKMLSKKLPIELISEMTGLSQKEINKIAVNT